jgi:hypothetical protein
VELPGYEADDLIAAYACKVRDLGGEVTIVSSDKDLMQLVGPQVSMLDTMKNLKIGHDQVVEKFGVPPDKVVDVQALCGDSVDNVPGAPGIGIKTASALILEYGDLDTLLARAGEVKQQKRRETLIEYADQIRLSRELVRLDCDTPLPEPIDDLVVREPDAQVLSAFLDDMGFRTLARRIDEAKGLRALGHPRRRDPRAHRAGPRPRRRQRLPVRPRPRDARCLDRPRLRRRRGRLRHRDRCALGQRGQPLRAVAGGRAWRGLLHPRRPRARERRRLRLRAQVGPGPDPSGRGH